MNIPTGKLRARIPGGSFVFVPVTENVEYLGNTSSAWGLRIIMGAPPVVYLTTVPLNVITTLRRQQYRVLAEEVKLHARVYQ